MRRRRSVLERQKSAQRLLFAAAEEVYDGELDIDWDRDPVEGKRWMPPRLSSIHGTRLWRRLTDQQRDEVCRRELVDILTVAMYLETAASMLAFRVIALEQGLDDDRTRFLLAMVNERARNVTMFSRLINRVGVLPYHRERTSDRLAHTVLMTPRRLLAPAVMVLAAQFVHSVAREVAADPEVQPHVAQLAKIHTVTAKRHIRFGWEEIADALDNSGRWWAGVQSIVAAVIVVALGPVLINPRIYRDVGIGPARGRWTAYLGRQYRVRGRIMTGEFVRAGIEAGLFRGSISRAILRLGRCWPGARAESGAGREPMP